MENNWQHDGGDEENRDNSETSSADSFKDEPTEVDSDPQSKIVRNPVKVIRIDSTTEGNWTYKAVVHVKRKAHIKHLFYRIREPMETTGQDKNQQQFWFREGHAYWVDYSTDKAAWNEKRNRQSKRVLDIWIKCDKTQGQKLDLDWFQHTFQTELES